MFPGGQSGHNAHLRFVLVACIYDRLGGEASLSGCRLVSTRTHRCVMGSSLNAFISPLRLLHHGKHKGIVLGNRLKHTLVPCILTSTFAGSWGNLSWSPSLQINTHWIGLRRAPGHPFLDHPTLTHLYDHVVGVTALYVASADCTLAV